MYSASIKDCVVTPCFLGCQIIVPLASKKTYPVVDFPSSRSLYVAFTKPLKVRYSDMVLYVIPYSQVPNKYCRIHFNAVICCILGLVVYDASRFTANAISGHIALAIYWSSPNNSAKELLLFISIWVQHYFDIQIEWHSDWVYIGKSLSCQYSLYTIFLSYSQSPYNSWL